MRNVSDMAFNEIDEDGDNTLDEKEFADIMK